METPELTAALDINQQTKDWTARIRVIEKPHPRVGRNSPVKFQRLLFKDDSGTKIQASIFGDEIQLFQGTFQVLKTYYVSNATVKPLDKEYRVGPYVSQWIINPGTLIENAEDDDSDLEILSYILAPYCNLHNQIIGDQQFDLIGAVVSMKPVRIISSPSAGKSLMREATIMMPVSISFWGPFAENEATQLYSQLDTCPVFIGVRLKATSFAGLTLSTRPVSTIIVNPDLKCAYNLQTWCKANKEIILSIMKTGNSFGDKARNLDPAAASICSIKDVLEGEHKTCMVNGIMSIENLNQEVYYTSCGDCRKVIHTKPDKIFHCFHCNQDNMISKMRVCFDVEVKDDTGSMSVTLYGDDAAQYFMLDAQTIMDHATKVQEKKKNSLSPLPQFINKDRTLPHHVFSIRTVTFIVTAEIRLKQIRYHKIGGSRYYVANMYDDIPKDSPSRLIRERP